MRRTRSGRRTSAQAGAHEWPAVHAGEAAAQQAGGTFDDVFDAARLDEPRAMALVAAVARTGGVRRRCRGSTWLFRALPDRGYGLSKLLGLVAVVVPTWAAGRVGPTAVLGPLAWSVFGALRWSGGGVLGMLRRRCAAAEARRDGRTWPTVEGVFLVGVRRVSCCSRYSTRTSGMRPAGRRKADGDGVPDGGHALDDSCRRTTRGSQAGR